VEKILRDIRKKSTMNESIVLFAPYFNQ